MEDTLDPQVVNLTKAIRQTESGGDFTAKGKSGEYGAYQFTEPTWKTYASKYGINKPLKDATPQEQNEVVYKKIKEWKDAGNNVGQIASMWNAGESNKDAYLGGHSGTNKYGVHYDTGAYAKSVASAYQSLKTGGQVGVDPSNPSSIKGNSVGNQVDENGYITNSNLPAPVRDSETAKKDENKPGLVQGLVQGIANTTGIPKLVATGSDFLKQGLGIGSQIAGMAGVPGATDLSNKIQSGLQDSEKNGVNLGYFGKVTPLGHTGSAMGDLQESVGTGIEGGLTASGIESGLGAIKGLISGGSKVLATPAVESAVSQFKMSMPEFEALSSSEKFNLLSEAVKNGGMSALDKVGIQNAIEKVMPAAMREAGYAPSLVKLAVSKAGSMGWKGIKTIAKIIGAGAGIATSETAVKRVLTGQ